MVTQLLLLAVVFLALAGCLLKLVALTYNLTWIVRYGQSYREQLDAVRSDGKPKSRSGLAEVYTICQNLGRGNAIFGTGVNEIALRLELETAQADLRTYSYRRVLILRAFFFGFDFVRIAFIGGLSTLVLLQLNLTPGVDAIARLIGGSLLVALILTITVLNFEATLYHVCLGRYAQSFTGAGDYLNQVEKNHLLNEIGLVAGQIVATVFVGAVALAYLAILGFDFGVNLTGEGIDGFFDAAYTSAMTFIFSTPAEPASALPKLLILVLSLQGGLVLLLALAVMMNSAGQRSEPR